MENLKSYDNFVNESKLQDDYRDFFSKLLKVYGVKSPAEFKSCPEEGEKFYEDIKKGWENGQGMTKYGKDIIDEFEAKENEK